MAALDSLKRWDDSLTWDDSQTWEEAIREDIVETAAFSPEYLLAGIVVVHTDAETAVIDSLTSIVSVNLTTEAAVVTNPEPTLSLVANVTDSAQLQDYTSTVARTTSNLLESAALTAFDYPSAAVTRDLAETAVLADVLAQAYPPVTLVESAILGDAIVHSATRSVSVVDGLKVNDYVTTAEVYNVADSTVVLGAAESTITLSDTVTESALLLSTTTIVESTYEVVTDAFTVSDFLTDVLNAITVATDGAFVSGEAFVDVALTDSVVMTANTVNWAMSRYTNAPFVGKAGDYILTNDGLFMVSGEYADSTLETGTTTFGTSHLKTLQYAYVDSTHENPINLTVTADIQGEESSFEYTQMARDASDTRNVRCQFGRGFRSTYFRLRLDGEGFVQTYGCTPVVEKLGRRI